MTNLVLTRPLGGGGGNTFETFITDSGTVFALVPNDVLSIIGGNAIITSATASPTQISIAVDPSQISIGDLGDVSLTSPITPGYILGWDGSTWLPVSASSAILGIIPGPGINIDDVGSPKTSIQPSLNICSVPFGGSPVDLTVDDSIAVCENGSTLQYTLNQVADVISKVINLGDLGDVVLTGSPLPTSGDVLVFVGSPSEWQHAPTSSFDQNLWKTINGDTGSTTANTPTDTLTIVGGTAITTIANGSPSTLTIDVNASEINLGDIGDVIIGSPFTDGYTLVYRTGSPTGWYAEPSTTTDEFVKVSSSDTTTGHLDDKVAAGIGISTNILSGSPGGDETLEISLNASIGDLNDVVLGSPINTGYVLGWNGTTWVATDVSTSQIGISAGAGITLTPDGSPTTNISISLNICTVPIGSPLTISSNDSIAVCDGSSTLRYTLTEVADVISSEINLGDLGDVNITGSPLPTSGDVLVFVGSPAEWQHLPTSSFDQNVWETITGDIGSTNASTPTDTLTIVGGTAVTTIANGSPSTLTIDVNTSEINLGDLGDVVIGSPFTDGYTLVYRTGSPTGWYAEPSTTTDEFVKVSSSDTTTGYLDDKISDGTGISTTIIIGSPGGVETLEISLDASIGDLNDVSLTSPISPGYVLSWNGTTWLPVSVIGVVAGDGISITDFGGSPKTASEISLNICTVPIGSPSTISSDNSIAVCDGASTLRYTLAEVADVVSSEINLGDLGDVDLTGSPLPSFNDILVFAGSPSEWQHAPISSFNQNIWETITGDTGSTTASTPTDTLTIVGGTAVITTANGSPSTITIDVNTSEINLGDLGDVVIGSPFTDGYTLVYRTGSPSGWYAEPSTTTDEFVKVTSTDTTTGYLNNKLVTGTGISKTTLSGSPGGFEALQISLNAELNDINDVSIGSPITTGYVLGWNGTSWVPTDVSITQIGITAGPGIDVIDIGSPKTSVQISLDACSVPVGGSPVDLSIDDSIVVCETGSTLRYTLSQVTNIIAPEINLGDLGDVNLTGSPLPSAGDVLIFAGSPSEWQYTPNSTFDQNLWETIQTEIGSVVASSPSDTLSIFGGIGISTNIGSGSPKTINIDLDFSKISSAGSPLTIDLTDEIIVNDGGIIIKTTLQDLVNQLGLEGDELVKISANDTTAGYLNGKLVTGTYTTLTENNDGSNETLTVDVDPSTIQIEDLGNVSVGSPISAGDILVFAGSPNEWQNVPQSSFDQNIWETISSDSGSTSANTTTDTLTIAGGTAVNTSVSGDTLTVDVVVSEINLGDLGDVIYTGSPQPVDGDVLIYRSGSPSGWFNEPSTSTDQLLRITSADTTSSYLNTKLLVDGPLTKTINNPSANETLTIGINLSTINIQDLGNVSGTNSPEVIPQGSILVANTFNTLTPLTVTPSSPCIDQVLVYDCSSGNIVWDFPTNLPINTYNTISDGINTASPNGQNNTIEYIAGDGIDITVAEGGVGSPNIDTVTITNTATLPGNLQLILINGQPTLVYEDTTRVSAGSPPGSPVGSPKIPKLLSVTDHPLVWSNNDLNNDDWMPVGNAIDADSGYIADFDGTVVFATGHTESADGNSKGIELYINGTVITTLGTLSGAGEASFINTTLDIDFSRGDKLQLRGSSTGGNIKDVIVKVTLKWRGN